MDYSSFLGIPVKTNTYKTKPDVLANSYLLNTGKKRKHQKSTQPLESDSTTSNDVTENTPTNSATKITGTTNDEPTRKRPKYTKSQSKVVSPLVLVFESVKKESNHYRIKHDHHDNNREQQNEHKEVRCMSISDFKETKNKSPKMCPITTELEQKQETPVTEQEILKTSSDTQESVCDEISKFICGECNGKFVSVNAMNKHFNMCAKISGAKLLKLKIKEMPCKKPSNKDNETLTNRRDNVYGAPSNDNTMHYCRNTNELDSTGENVTENVNDKMPNIVSGNEHCTVINHVLNTAYSNIPETTNNAVLETFCGNVLDTNNDAVSETVSGNVLDTVNDALHKTFGGNVLETINDAAGETVSGNVQDTVNDAVLETVSTLDTENYNVIKSDNENMHESDHDNVPDNEHINCLHTAKESELQTGNDMPENVKDNMLDDAKENMIKVANNNMHDTGNDNKPAVADEKVLDSSFNNALDTTIKNVNDLTCNNLNESGNEKVLCTANKDMHETACGNVPQTESGNVFQTTSNNVFQTANISMKDIKDQTRTVTVASDCTVRNDNMQVSDKKVNNTTTGNCFNYTDWNNSDYIRILDCSDLNILDNSDQYGDVSTDDSGLSSLDNSDFFLQKTEKSVTNSIKGMKNEDDTVQTHSSTDLTNFGENKINSTEKLNKNAQNLISNDSDLTSNAANIKQDNNTGANKARCFLTDTFDMNETLDNTTDKTSTPIKSTITSYSADICNDHLQTSEQNPGRKLCKKLDYTVNIKGHQMNRLKKRQSNLYVYTEAPTNEIRNNEMLVQAVETAKNHNVLTSISDNSIENTDSKNLFKSYKSVKLETSTLYHFLENTDESADHIDKVNTSTPSNDELNPNENVNHSIDTSVSEQEILTTETTDRTVQSEKSLNENIKFENASENLSEQLQKDKEQTFTEQTDQTRTDEIKCKKCNVTFISKTCYTNHLIMYHHPTYKWKNLFKCGCSAWNKSHDSYYNGSLKQHLTNSHNFQDMNCFRCRTKFECYQELENHIKFCDKDFAKKRDSHLQCKLCKMMHVIVETDEIDEILKEVEQELPTEERVIEVREKAKQVQTNRVQQSCIPKFKCKKCDKGFHLWKCCINHVAEEHLGGINTRTEKMFRFLSRKHSNSCDACGTHKYACNFNEQLQIILKKGIYNQPENDLLAIPPTEAENEVLHKIHSVMKSMCTVEVINEKKLRHCTACGMDFRQYGCCVNHILLHHMDDSMTLYAKTRFFKNACVRCSKCKIDHMWAINNPHWLSNYLDIDKELPAELKMSSELQANHEQSKLAMEYAEMVTAGPVTIPQNTELEQTGKEGSKFIDMSIVAEVQDLLAIDYGREKQFNYAFGRKQSGKVECARSRVDIEEDMKERMKFVNGKFRCRICDAEFQEYICCKDHILTEHHLLFTYPGGSEVYGCPICKTFFQNLYFLDRHLMQYHALYKYSCLQCRSNFNFRQDYNYHLKLCKRKKIEAIYHKKLSCRHCRLIHSCLYNTGESQRLKDYLEKENNSHIHKSQCHLDKNGGNVQAESSNVSDAKETTNKHDDVVFDGKNFLCLICDKTFKTANCCSVHVLFEHKRRGDLKCPVCDQDFHFKTKIDKHLKSAHHLEQIYCKNCFLGFEDASALKHHSKRCNGRKSSINKLSKQVCRHCYRPHGAEEDSNIKENCLECISGFSSIECSRNHFYVQHFPDNIALVSKTNMFKCPCGKECVSKTHLQKHLSNNHSNDSPKYTDSEEKNHRNEEVSQENRQDQSKDGKYFDTYVTNSSGFRKCVCCDHMHVVASETSKTNRVTPRKRCDTCKKTFKTTQCYQNHELITHCGEYATRKCVECSRYFPSASSLRQHQKAITDDELETENSTKDMPEKSENPMLNKKKICKRGAFLFEVKECMMCNQFHQNTFDMYEMPVGNNTRKTLKEEKDTNENGPRKINCKYCTLVFTSFSDLSDHEKQKHKRDEHTLNEKGGKCTVCKIQLKSDEDMCEHIIERHAKMTITEAEERDSTKFSCVYCNSNFMFAMDAQLHLRKEHFMEPLMVLKHMKKSKERILGQSIIHCPLCTFVLSNKNSSVAEHIRRKHFNILQTKKSSDCICEICGTKFATKFGLDQHMHKHKAYRSFKCHKCGKEFPFYPNLQTHMKTHMEKQEQCEICGMKFRLPHHVRAHMKRLHDRK